VNLIRLTPGLRRPARPVPLPAPLLHLPSPATQRRSGFRDCMLRDASSAVCSAICAASTSASATSVACSHAHLMRLMPDLRRSAQPALLPAPLPAAAVACHSEKERCYRLCASDDLSAAISATCAAASPTSAVACMLEHV